MESDPREGLVEQACPDCKGGGCEVCEGSGIVLVQPATRQANTSRPTSEEGDEVRTERPTLKGGHDPREMALRRAAMQRARKEREERGEPEPEAIGGDDVRLLRVPVNVSKIVNKLNKEAAKGSTAAAKELRAWMAEIKPETVTGLDDLDRRTRQRLLVRLLAEDEAAQPSSDLVRAVEGDDVRTDEGQAAEG